MWQRKRLEQRGPMVGLSWAWALGLPNLVLMIHRFATSGRRLAIWVRARVELLTLTMDAMNASLAVKMVCQPDYAGEFNFTNEAINLLKIKPDDFSARRKAINLLKISRLFQQSHQVIENK